MATEVPGPAGYPIIGNTVGLMRGQGSFLEAAVDEYGPVTSVSMVGMGELVLVSDPALVGEVLHDDEYVKASLARETLSDLLGNGLVLARGETWRRQRSLVQPALESDRLGEYATVMRDRTNAFTDDLQPDVRYDIGDEMRQLTFQILLDAMFGTDIDYEQWGLREQVEALMAPGKPSNQPIAYTVPKWVPIPMWRRYHRAVDRFDDIVERLIEQRRTADSPGDDLLSRLLAATDEEGGMSDTQLRDELVTMLFAGHETTATALTFAWHLLGHNPEVDAKLAAETDEVLSDGTAEISDVQQLSYTERVVRETMRLYPPVPALAREPTADVELGGHHIPAGTTVVPCQWTVHHDPELYDDPWAFRPERWAERPLEQRHRYAYFPFGGGPRRCVGESFAMAEAQIILSTIANEYRLTPATDAELNPSVSIVTQPTTEIEVVPERR